MTKKKKGHIFKQERTRIFKDKRNDPYAPTEKNSGPTVCTRCGALYEQGRWTWNDIPEEAEETLCPACKRILNNYPAGYIKITGDFYSNHHYEVINLRRNTERKEMREHPLERIMNVEQHPEDLLITTTGIHLALQLGEALESSFQGEVEYSFDGESFVRVYWRR